MSRAVNKYFICS